MAAEGQNCAPPNVRQVLSLRPVTVHLSQQAVVSCACWCGVVQARPAPPAALPGCFVLASTACHGSVKGSHTWGVLKQLLKLQLW